jgi:hypothetical protein
MFVFLRKANFLRDELGFRDLCDTGYIAWLLQGANQVERW